MRRRNWLLGGASVLVVALGVTGWLWTASRTADDVQVYWRDGDPTCTGTTVKYDEELDARVFDAVNTMRCTVRVGIRNGSGRTVHLHHVTAPFVGPETGAVVTARDAAPEAETGGRDAVFALDVDLEAGQSTVLDIVLVFHPAGCNDGGTMWMDSWPSVSFEALNRTYDRATDETLAFHRKGRSPGCARF